MASVRKQPHAFVFPYPVQGHINPMMCFSKLLASNHGFVISFLNSQENHIRLTAVSNDAPPSQEKVGEGDIRMLWLPDIPPSSQEVSEIRGNYMERSHIVLSKTFLNTDPAALEELIRSQEPPVTCLICDWLVPVIAPGLAQKLGISMFVFFTASAASLLMAMLSGEVNGDAKQLTSIVGAPPLEVGEVNPFLSMCGGPSDFMCSFFTQAFREKLVQATDTILINTFQELENPTLQYLMQKHHRIFPIGPLLPFSSVPTLWPQDCSCLDWLDKQPPASVLYVSFGSLAPLSSTQLLELALGLEASHQRILWVTRPDQIYGGAPDLPPDFLDRIKDRLLVVSWAPQLHVLFHSSVGGFLSHCGWNSTLESISAGVPMLGWPFFGDQMMNCKFVVDTWRIGSRLTVDGCVTRAEVQRKVRELMEGELGKELRKRARELRDVATAALAEGGSSYQNLRTSLACEFNK